MNSSAGKFHRARTVTAVLLMAMVAATILGLVGPGHAAATAPGKNGRLLFDLRDGELGSARADGTGFRKASIDPSMRIHWEPTWNANGKDLLAVGSSSSLTHRSKGVFSVPTDGGEPELLWDTDENHPVVVSPDGRYLAKTHAEMLYPRTEPEHPDPANGIYIRDLRNGTTKKLDLGPFLFPEEVIFSPDAKRIAYRSVAMPHQSTVVIDSAKLDGSDVREVASFSDRWVSAITYSPDGRSLAFASGDIFTIRMDGSRLKRVTRTGQAWNPVFSPDGQKIAYTKGHPYPSDDPRAWIAEADGSGARPVKSGPDEKAVLDWAAAAPFVYKGFVKRTSKARVRVFGPGKVMVSGSLISRRSRTSRGTEVLRVPIAPRPGVRLAAGAELRVKIRFAPKGGLPSVIEKKVRLGGR